MKNTTTTLDELVKAADRHLPEWSPEQQRAGLVLFSELARGEPVDPPRLARALETTVPDAEALLGEPSLGQFVDADEDGSAQGFWGLSTVPTQHRFALDDRTLWTWCAFDTLFLPELLGRTARIESVDPEGGEPIRLIVSPAGIETAAPEETVVSMNSPDTWELSSAAQVIASTCHFMFFFASQATGERWAAEHPGTVLLSLEEAFKAGKLQNQRLFGTELARRAQ